MATGDYDAIIRQLIEEMQQQPQGQQMAQNDGFNPVAATGAQGNGAAFYDMKAKQPNVMRPAEVWSRGRKTKRMEVNDNADFFGGK